MHLGTYKNALTFLVSLRAHFHAFVLKTQDIIDGCDGDGSDGNLVMIVMVIRIILLVMMMTQGKSWAWFEGRLPGAALLRSQTGSAAEEVRKSF